MSNEEKALTYDEIQTELKPEQIRYANLKATSTLSQRQIAEQLGVHYNTLTNWNKNPLVLEAIKFEIEFVKQDNSLKIQQLMQHMLREAITILIDKDTNKTVKSQMIGQLFTSVGKYAGLEPTKKVQKDINVTKSFEQLLSDVDEEIEEVEYEVD
jgi:DNA-binding transcriptional regulator YhcF (GntR family)